MCRGGDEADHGLELDVVVRHELARHFGRNCVTLLQADLHIHGAILSAYHAFVPAHQNNISQQKYAQSRAYQSVLSQLGEGGPHGAALDCLIEGMCREDFWLHAICSRVLLHLHIYKCTQYTVAFQLHANFPRAATATL